LFFCPSRYDARHRKPRRCVYAFNLGGTGISTPDNFSYRSNFRSRSNFRFRSSSSFSFSFRSSFRFRSRSRSSSCSTTSGDIFYCSGIRQLNHSSCIIGVTCLTLFFVQNDDNDDDDDEDKQLLSVALCIRLCRFASSV